MKILNQDELTQVAGGDPFTFLVILGGLSAGYTVLNTLYNYGRGFYDGFTGN